MMIFFQISNWRVPSISSKDKVLHSVFLMSILIMIICSVATILSFKQADTLPKVSWIRSVSVCDDESLGWSWYRTILQRAAHSILWSSFLLLILCCNVCWSESWVYHISGKKKSKIQRHVVIYQHGGVIYQELFTFPKD